MKRKSGVLLPVSSQMGEFGIGDFGQNAKFFLDYIKRMGFSVWQVLPITTIGAGNSPYSGISAFAGNYLLIDISCLHNLVSIDEINFAKIDSSFKVDYPLVKESKEKVLRLAYERITDDLKQKIENFVAVNRDWLPDYALYSYLKKITNKPWFEWEPEVRDRNPAKIRELFNNNLYEINYYYFEQYIFFEQWNDIKKYSNSIGVQIFGDIPIYVSHDSVDVWANPRNFLLDDDLQPAFLAGVPPDYFSEDGQLWGNPIYDYNEMKKNNYKWFVDRILFNLEMYDILRIDHFRGLYEYWSIPRAATSAREGKWVPGPGFSLWDQLPKEIIKGRIVVEDLGIIDSHVTKFREKLGFPGMRVLQFGFDGNVNNAHLPHNFASNTVAYSGTHDNPPILGWLYELSSEQREQVLEYLGFHNQDWGTGGRHAKSTKHIARVLLSSVADTVILPIQDLSSYGSDTRINVPGIPDNNWEYRCTLSLYDDIDVGYFNHLNLIYGRTIDMLRSTN